MGSVMCKYDPKKLVGNEVILETRDQNNQFHWWCETRNGEVQINFKQYSDKNIDVPSTGRHQIKRTRKGNGVQIIQEN